MGSYARIPSTLRKSDWMRPTSSLSFRQSLIDASDHDENDSEGKAIFP